MDKLAARTITLPLLVFVAVAVFAVMGVIGGSVIGLSQIQIASHSDKSITATDGAGPKHAAHPCNHGFYVSQAARAHKGGAYVSAVAHSDLGKNGTCSGPLPAQAPKPGSTSPPDD